MIGNLMVILAAPGHWGIFPGDAATRLNFAMRVAFGEFSQWCRSRAVHTSQEVFTGAMLNRSDSRSTFPRFKCKAANGRWVATWLNDVLYTRGRCELEEVVIWGACDLLHVMHSHNCDLLPRRAAS